MRSPESFVLTFLLNALWQLPLLTAVAWAGALLLRRAPAAYRHRVWVAALGLSLLVPLVSALRPSKLDVAQLVARAPWAAAALEAPRPGMGAADREARAVRPPVAAALLRATAAGYCLFVLVLAIRLRGAWRRTERIAREAQPAPAALAEHLDGSGVELRVSSAVAAPMTFGIRRPVVVLPLPFARSGSPEAVRGVLAHELAHVRRSDCAVNLLCELLALPLAFHPVVRLLRRRVAGAREMACDEAAARLVGAREYAATLLDIAVMASRGPRDSGALGALDGDGLEDRMKRVLDTRAPLGRRRAFALLAVGVFALALAGRGAAAAAVQVASEPGPDDMVGTWTGAWAKGDRAGEPAAELAIALGPNGPVIDLTLYRYKIGSKETPQLERPPVVSHRVEKGVLHFRTRSQVPLKDGGPAEILEVDWDFSVVGKDAGQLRVTQPKLAADRAAGKDVPPPPPPLAMKRVRRG